MKTLVLTTLALLAFAGNSILCRLALSHGVIDAGSFTAIRLGSGALVLFAILLLGSGRKPQKSHLNVQQNSKQKRRWLAALSLFSYAALFSYAYLSLDTATGALILFGTVQISMILFSIINGGSLSRLEWCGFVMACGGFLYLVIPEVQQPSFMGLVMMMGSGLAWAVYTLEGRGSIAPLQDTAYNFLRTLPMVLVMAAAQLLLLLVWPELNTDTPVISRQGVILAMLSGGLTSGVGYAIWYAVLKDLSTSTAAVIQLSVPIIAAVFGVVFASEILSLRLIVSGLVVLGGILFVIIGRERSLG